MVACDNCSTRIARSTAETYEELVMLKHELNDIGVTIIREGRDDHYRYFVDWSVPTY